MSAHMNIVSMVERKMLIRTLVVIRLAHFVAVAPLYNIMFHLTLMQTQWVSDLLGLVDTKICSFVNLLPTGTADR